MTPPRLRACATALLLVVAGCCMAVATGGAQSGAPSVTAAPFPELRGPYLGQTPPGRSPERFAPGIVSTPGPDSVPRFSSDGREVYWSHIGPGGGVLRSRRVADQWTKPERIDLGTGGMDVIPFLFDGSRKLFFLSTRPLPDGRRPNRGFFTFWIAPREADAWGQPRTIDSFFSGWDDFSAIGEDGTLFVGAGQQTRTIYRIAPQGTGYATPAPLGAGLVGLPAMVGPGEKYLIFSSARDGGFGATDLYISFRQADGSWGSPVNMGPEINSKSFEHFASLTSDGKYLFFCSERDGDIDVYWVDARVIDDLKRAQAVR